MNLRFDHEARQLAPKTALLAGGVGLALLAMARFFPWSKVPSFCGFRNFTGHPCPGCGMTRSWIYIIHGRVLDGMTINPFGSLLFVWLVLSLLYLALRSFAGLPAIRLSFTPTGRVVFWSLLGVLLAANWAYTWMSGVAL